MRGWSRLLAQNPITVDPQLAIHSQQQHRLHPALAHQHLIKGIAMLPNAFQFRHRQQMGVADRQPAEALQRHLPFQFLQTHPQPAQRGLDRHLPQGSLAHKHLRLRGLNALHHLLRLRGPDRLARLGFLDPEEERCRLARRRPYDITPSRHRGQRLTITVMRHWPHLRE